MKPIVKTIASQLSWVVRNDQVELAVTQRGGHMAPVTFLRKSSSPIQPYYISPWQNEALKIPEPALVPLRGDFLCAPFGANAEPYRGEKHPLHGEPAGSKWKLQAVERSKPLTCLTLTMQTRIRTGQVTRRLMLLDGQNVVYTQETFQGYSGAMPAGHHATLALPDEPRTVHIATSSIRFGMTNPAPIGDPATGAYQALAIHKRFSNLRLVPVLWPKEGHDDGTTYPARKGFCDLLGVFNKLTATPAWTTATFETEGFLWFSLKDPTVLPTTLLWISNHGRYGSPWNGRNRCLGLEDVCGFFADGLAASVRPNVLSRQGIPTALKFSKARPTVIRYIQGVVKVPRGFGHVRSARFTVGKVTFSSVTGKKVVAQVCNAFLKSGQLPC